MVIWVSPHSAYVVTLPCETLMPENKRLAINCNLQGTAECTGMVNWYRKLGAAVRWNGVLSSFLMFIAYGGVLSPLLYNLYVDYLLCELKASKLGCCIKDIYAGCVMYADDIMLLYVGISSYIAVHVEHML